MKPVWSRARLRAQPLVHFAICSFAPGRPFATMRVYYFALVACTATLAGSTNASEPSNATMAKAELAADVRSAHGDHDGVAVKEQLEVHDHKTGEERMSPVVHASEEIEEVAHELLSAWRKSAQFEATVSRENELLSFNRDALDHYVKTQPVDKKSMHAWLEEAIRARKDPDKRGDSLKEPQEAYRAHLEALALQGNLEKKSRFELHPVEVLRLIIPQYKDVGNRERHSADVVYEELETYINKYNAARPGTPPVAMLPTLSEGFVDLPRLESFLSEVKLNPVHVQAVERMEQLLSDFLIWLIRKFDDLAIEAHIPPQGQSLLANRDVDSFSGYISAVMNSLPSDRWNVFAP